jgi:glutathione S-transferase
MQLQSSTTVTAGVPVVTFEGSVDLSTLARLRDPLLRAVVEHRGSRVVVDLDGVDVLDDTGLGILLGTAGRAREGGGELLAVVTAAHLRRRFATSGLDRAIALFPSIAAATAATPPAALFHIALPADFEAARETGAYTVSSRGRSLAEEGFIHCSFAHQVDATLRRFYDDVDTVVVLRIDPAAVADIVVVEDLADTGEPFPHLYGPLPMAAVVGTELRRLR